MPARRTKGDGGLTQRHDHPSCPPRVPATGERPEHKCRGRWQGTLPVSTGSSRKKYVYGRTQEEVRKKLRDAVTDRDNGTLVLDTMTVERWLLHWLEDISEVRGNTYASYKSKINRYLIPHIGKHRLTKLRPEHIRSMWKALRTNGGKDGQPLAESSLRQAHAILGRALRVAVQEGKLVRNPLEAVQPPSTKTNRRARLTMAQAQQVLAFTDEARWWLAIFYGMRQGEVLGLRWCDVFDLFAEPDAAGKVPVPYLSVVQTLQKDRSGKQVFGPPKSDAGERDVPLIPVMAARLKLAHAAAGSPAADSTELVFPGPGGKPRGPKKDWEAWRELLEAASILPDGTAVPLPAVSLHSARNTSASLLEAAGVPPRLVGQIIGHANVQQTEHYQHAEMERMYAALTAGASLLEVAALDPGSDPAGDSGVVEAELVET